MDSTPDTARGPAAAADTTAADTAGRLLATVTAVAAELRGGRAPAGVTLDSAIDRDLGIDSLGRVELMARLERDFAVVLSDTAFAEAETPRDLLRAVQGAAVGGRAAPMSTDRREAVEPAAGAGALPLAAQTLVEALAWHATHNPDHPHIRLYDDDCEAGGEGRVITYRELYDEATRMAAGLQALDLQPGQAAAIMLPTGPDYFFAFFGILMAGGIAVPVYPPARLAQIEEHLRRHIGILGNCQARVLVTVEEAKPLGKVLRGRLGDLNAVATPDEVRAAAGTLRRPVLGPGDTAFLQYTSGSTGAPKGVVLTHGNLLANVRAMGEMLEVGPADVFVSWLPLYHDMGLIGAWLGTLHYAVPLVIMSPLHFLARPKRWLWAIHRFRGTISAAPNFAYELCLRRLDDKDLAGLDLSCWRAACNGAEAVSPDTVEQFADRFAAWGFRRQAMMPVYGLAENSVGLAFPPLGRGPVVDRIGREAFMRDGTAVPAGADDPTALRFVACGRPIVRHQIRVVDEAGREVPDRQEGRLQFKGPSSTSGYYRAPDKNADLFDGDWLQTGDKAYTVDGEIYVTGRSKDIIIRAGRNIYPPEIEEAVGDLDGIHRGCVAVFGSPDPDSGTERLVVLAECRKRDEAARAALAQQINALVTDLTGGPPDDVVLAPPRTVPKTSSGKIRRAASREIYETGAVGAPRRAAWVQIARIALAGAGPRLARALRRGAEALYAGWVWAVFAIGAPLTWLPVVVLPTAGGRWAALRLGLRAMLTLTGLRVALRGADNLPPPGTPAVVVCNHASYLDGFFVAAALPRRVAFVVKGELVGHWATRIPMARLGFEFVQRFDRHAGVEDSRRITGAARAGRLPLFFAEGTFSRMAGLLPFRMGAFAAAAEARVPVIPCVLRGSRTVLRDGSWFPRRNAVSLTVGPAIAAPADGSDWDRAVALRDASRAWILAHCGEPDLGAETSPVADLADRRTGAKGE
ncbi:MAG: AMP-binding protein [Hyphomicrobiales bacterium]|nr:AMP-binding protein [Hyphomicrobiales bacterium]MCP5371946.1 AMP-binding protein [Hyphomicrobiales bacterium]